MIFCTMNNKGMLISHAHTSLTLLDIEGRGFIPEHPPGWMLHPPEL